MIDWRGIVLETGKKLRGCFNKEARNGKDLELKY
jgi:hypothetical protein